MAEAEGIPRVRRDSDSLEILWPEGYRSRHLYYWLRENCHCRQCAHSDAWERLVDFMAIPLDIAPLACRGDAGGIHIEWPQGGAPCEGSCYSWAWLDRHRCEPEARRARETRRTAWTAADVDKGSVSIGHDTVTGSGQGLLELLERIENLGVALVTGVPCEQLAVVDLAERIGFIEESHFGRHFDVESKPRAENLAYTHYALHPHNDLPSRRQLPGIQFLHCLCNDAQGGDSVLVDSMACAARLREGDEAAFDLLSRERVTFTSIADDWHIVNRGTLIEVDEDGAVIGTRLHPALLGPVDIEPELQPAFYRAHRQLLTIARSEKMQFRFRLEPGDCQVFDNYRVMHARSAFDPARGHRHLQGCYVGRDEFASRLELLRRKGTDFRRI